MVQISVVINTYNSSKFICETIQTVLSQSFQDFELIIVDDGSKDNTLEVVATFEDPRIQVYPYANGGISKSRNRGIKHASGEYISFLDHDDLWHERKLEQQWLALQENPQAGFAYSWLETIDETGDSIRFYPKIWHSGRVYKKLLAQSFIHTASNPLLRREAVITVGGFDEEIYGADDWDLLIRLSEKYDVILSPNYHIRYRIVKGSGSANVTKLERGATQVIEKAFRSAPEDLQPIKSVALGRVYQYLCFRTLEEMAGRRSGLAAWRYLRLSRRHHPALWGQAPLFKALFKIVAVVALPKPWAQRLVPWVVARSRAATVN